MNNTKLSKKIIYRQDMVLIKNSEEAKNVEMYGNLFDAISEYKTLSIKEIEEDIFIDSKAKTVLLNNKMMLMNNIMEEWGSLGEPDYATTEMHCQLCGHKNSVIYYIKNKYNDNILNVGSDCIHKFSGHENVFKNVKSKSEIDKIRLEQKRKIEIEEHELNDFDFVNDAYYKYQNFDIVLPFDLQDEIKKTLSKITYFKDKYIKTGGDLSHICELRDEAKRKYISLWMLAEQYYIEHKDHNLICHKSEGDWLYENNRDVLVTISKNGGIFTRETLRYVYNEKFINDHLSDFRNHLVENSIKILYTSNNLIRFVLQDSIYRNPVSFTVSNKFFMQFIGCHCLTTPDYKYNKNNLNEINLDQTDSNFDSLFNRMRKLMNAVNLDIELSRNNRNYCYLKKLSQITSSRSKIRTIRTEVGYRKINYKVFITFCNDILFESDEIIITKFRYWYNTIELRREWISKDQKDTEERIAADAPSLKQQREFI